MVSRHVRSGEDKSGLGQWSYVEIAGRDKRKVVLITGYRPCIQSNTGDNIVTAQQNVSSHKKECMMHNRASSGTRISLLWS
eukprot:15361146-Ditylum_brightwellii.AAC.2